MLKYKRSSSSTTQDSKSTKAPPHPIAQTKISLSYNNLKQIPTNALSNTIIHIYISHNNISSLVGIQEYKCLQSLNVSYNCLHKKEQLVQLLPNSLKKLSINQNRYPYGIEDYIIQKIPNLQRLDDEKLPSLKARNYRFMAKNYIADNILEALIKFHRLLAFIKNYQMQMQIGSEISQQEQISLKLLYQNISQDKISKLGFLVAQDSSMTKDTLLTKISKIIQLFNTINLLCICRPYNYIQQITQQGKLILDKILIRFASRNNKTLKNELIKISQQNNLSLDSSFIKAFKRMNGDKIALNNQPGKHISQIDMRQFLKGHQINNFISKPIKEMKPNASSYKQLNKENIEEIIKQQKSIQTEVLMERLPIFIYQKNYIEIIYEILKEESLYLIKLFDNIQHLARKKSTLDKRCNQQIQQQLVTQVSKIQNLKSIEKSVTFLQDITKNHTQRKAGVQRKSILKGIGSEQQTQKNTPQPGKISQIRKTIPLFELGISTEKEKNRALSQFDQRKYEMQSYIKQETEKCWYKNQSLIDLSKYELHQINLIYKVFRSLKRHTKKKQRKRLMIQL